MCEAKKYPCCAYELDGGHLYGNFHTQDIKQYGNELILADGTVLYRKKCDPEKWERRERKLVRCTGCGALFIQDYYFEYENIFDGCWSCYSWYPVATEEEADLLNILMDGEQDSRYVPGRYIFRSGWRYKWQGEGDPEPRDPEELRKQIRKKYRHADRDQLEDLIRKAGQEHMAEKVPMPEPAPEPEEDKEAEEEDWLYMANFDRDPPTLIRLGSFAKMKADMYVYPGVWKNTPHLNDIRVGIGCYMDYDEIGEKTVMELMKKLQKEYDRIREEREKGTEP